MSESATIVHSDKDSNLLTAVVNGEIEPFEEKAQRLEQIVFECKDTILHVHIKSSRAPSTEFVQKLLDICPSLPLQVNDKGDTPLHVAAQYGHAAIAEVLLQHARDVLQDPESGERSTTKMLKMKNYDGRTAFDNAVREKAMEVVKILIKEADPDFLDFLDNFRTLIRHAADSGDHEMLAAVAEVRNAESPAPEGSSGTTALQAELMNSDFGDWRKRTILHYHIGRPLPSIEFVEKILDICPSLLVKVDSLDDSTPLHVAAEHGHSAIAEFLLKRARYLPQDPESGERADKMMLRMTNWENNPALHVAVTYGKFEVVKVLLSKADPEILYHTNAYNGDTPLHVAARKGHSAIAEFLLKCARDLPQNPETGERAHKMMLRMTNRENNTALHEAMQYNQIEMVKVLCKEDLEIPYYANTYDVTPLYLAIENGDYEMLVAMLSCKETAHEGHSGGTAFQAAVMNSDILGNESKDTVLHVHIKSSSRPSTEFVKKILDICPSLILEVNAKGDTPLHVAAKHGQSAVAEFLLERAKGLPQDPESGERANKKMLRMTNKEKNTALHEAVRYGYGKVVQILTKEGGRNFSYFANNFAETPLYVASEKGDIGMVAEIFYSCESVAHEGPNGMTALHAAVLNDTQDDPDNISLKIMNEIYLKKESLTKVTDDYGWTPLHYAAYYGFSDKVSRLLEFDKSAAYIADKDHQMTPLHMAASQGHLEIIEKIISQCAECCERVDDKGWNVLHFAMLGLSKIDLRILLKNPLVRSLINEKDVMGNTPLHIRAATYRDSFSHIGDRQAINKEDISVEHILKFGSHKLEEEIQKLFEDVGRGQYSEGVIRERKDEHYSKIRDERRKKYFDGLKETRSSQLLVATLIATVTFTAAFTIPGGYSDKNDLDQGTAILRRNLAFQIFIITDTIALTLSLSAVFVHFIMSFEKFQKFQNLFTLASCLTMLAMGGVVVAFVTGIYSVLAPSLWLAIVTCVLGLSFFLLVLCALKLIYWRVFLEWQRKIFFKCQRMVGLQSSHEKMTVLV